MTLENESNLEYIPTPYQELGYAGEEMLNYFLIKMGYDGIRYPETIFSLWKEAVLENPFNEYAIKIKARGIDNWIRHPTKGRINFEVKNFGHKRFGNKSTSKLSYRQVSGSEILDKFRPRLKLNELCILVLSHEEIIPRKAITLLQEHKIISIVYGVQVLPNDAKTFNKAISKLYRTRLQYIVRP